jgi:hypothetical protein
MPWGIMHTRRTIAISAILALCTAGSILAGSVDDGPESSCQVRDASRRKSASYRSSPTTDGPSTPLLAAAGVTVAAGGVFTATAALEPSKTPRPIWLNSWFDAGLACVIFGLALAALGLYLNLRKQESMPPAAGADKHASIRVADGPGAPLTVKILADSCFASWSHSARIAALHVQIENITNTDILVDDYEFSYDPEGRPTWEQQATNDEQLSVRHEIHRRDECQEHGQPLRNFTRINALSQISGWLLAPTSRNPAGGTPECTVVVVDDDGNRYPAKLSRRKPRTYDPMGE